MFTVIMNILIVTLFVFVIVFGTLDTIKVWRYRAAKKREEESYRTVSVRDTQTEVRECRAAPEKAANKLLVRFNEGPLAGLFVCTDVEDFDTPDKQLFLRDQETWQRIKK